tara:strand:+ start:36 stop:338 length:303 start_codon:yes stop_codon:yes gene_type:complete
LGRDNRQREERKENTRGASQEIIPQAWRGFITLIGGFGPHSQKRNIRMIEDTWYIYANGRPYKIIVVAEDNMPIDEEIISTEITKYNFTLSMGKGGPAND